MNDVNAMRRAAMNIPLPYTLPNDDVTYRPDYGTLPSDRGVNQAVMENVELPLLADQQAHLDATLQAFRALFEEQSLRVAGPATVAFSHVEGKPFNHSFAVRDPAKLKAMKDIVSGMVKEGILVPSSSPFSSASFVVPKPFSKKWRFVTDFRPLNKVTRPIRGSPPPIQALLDSLRENPIRSQMSSKDNSV
eukprot:scaffold1090_cov265-Pinguiococcus_pyrenoidosus.AAC.38